MDLVEFVDIRRRRHLATTLSDFEQGIERELKRAFEGKIPARVSEELDNYKASVRKKFAAFAEDFTDIAKVSDVAVNAAAIELSEQAKGVSTR
jgi:hypothetical protein